MRLKDIKIFLKMRNKVLLSIEKKNRQYEKIRLLPKQKLNDVFG